ncbi:low molecular weight protein-tyrosine-phosphatase [Marinoscillum sp.]|uniref:low molecular weight protein-tyrosine-phosphatase n=1 Tax=Marinoscillum sp. TaxID=2024838 RepID=UPI003BABC81B
MIKIIFVCLGNICRSPLAEAICQHKIKKKGLEGQISCDSAGTANYHIGEEPDSRSIEVAVKHNIPIDHKGRQFHHTDGTNYQYILAMDESNYRNIIHELGYKHDGLYLMRNFDSQGRGMEVPDPYYGGKDGFEDVYQILDRSIEEFLEFVIETNHL